MFTLSQYMSTDTSVRYNMMTTCLLLCWSAFCCQNSADPLAHGLHLTWSSGFGLWDQDVCKVPLNPVNCTIGPPWIGLVYPAHPTDAQLDWAPEDLEATSTPQTFCSGPQTSPWTIFALWHVGFSCWKSLQPSGNNISMTTWFLPQTTFDRYWSRQMGNTQQEFQFWRCSDQVI